MKLQIGLDAITSYRRLAYTPWHAIAEFIDNSTQSYFDHSDELTKVYKIEGGGLEVSIVYDRDDDLLRISDNAMGMSATELEHALYVAKPPQNTTGRSKYGMGLKTAACWIGNTWQIRTKKLGEEVEHTVVVDVNRIATERDNDLQYTTIPKSDNSHYTIIEIWHHNRKFQGRTLGKIRDFLSSMYRVDFRNKILTLRWQGSILEWHDYDDRLLKAPDGSVYRKTFKFKVDNKLVHGWVGILDRGSRADAGFSIIHCGRVIRGWPDSWRPTTLYGQLQGSNDLVNQRLVGEINLDEFQVSHTKDDILWLGDQEEQVEEGLLEACNDYKEFALRRRKGGDDERGPSDIETQTALNELKHELLSPEMVDTIKITVVPPQQVVSEAVERIRTAVVSTREPQFSVSIDGLKVKIYLDDSLSPNDPYVTNEATSTSEVIVIVNSAHPHWGQLKGSEGVLNYLRHCTYDAIAEWQARSKAARVDPDTIKLLKDQLLRVPMSIEKHEE